MMVNMVEPYMIIMSPGRRTPTLSASGSRVDRAGRHRRTFGETGFGGRLGRDRAGDIGRPQQARHLVGPSVSSARSCVHPRVATS